MSLTLLASNNASTVLASSINASATTLTVNTGAGSLFPSPVSGTSFFKLTLIDAATGQLTEIVHVTARTGDVMTIERAQEGTAARVWSANDIAANMMTAGTLSYILGSFQPLDATLTALAGLTGAADKLPYFNGDDTALLTTLTAFAREILAQTDANGVLSKLGLGNGQSGVVGETRNLKMGVTAASASATLSADEIIVAAALGGAQYRIGNFSKSINLSTTGAGGMDTGAAPASGFVGIYAIYNPTTASSALLAVNATSTAAAAIYSGSNMPAGYTASALLTVVPTNSSGNFKVCAVRGRTVSIQLSVVFSFAANIPGQNISIASAVPKNAIEISGELSASSSAICDMSISVNSDNSLGLSQQNLSTGISSITSVYINNFGNVMLTTPQQIGVGATVTAGTPNFSYYVSGYKI